MPSKPTRAPRRVDHEARRERLRDPAGPHNPHRWDKIKPIPQVAVTDCSNLEALPPPLPPTVPLRVRHDGWTAERQRIFLTLLAETGSVTLACIDAGVSSRSAYRLRARPDATAFAAAWDHALKLATVRLTTLAFERATRGTVREYWKHGELVAQTRQPSDRLLVFLLQHLLPAGRSGERWGGFAEMTAAARTGFPEALDALADHPVEMVPIEVRDFFAPHPGDADEDA